MTYAPIVIFVYNRADHFTKTYNALSLCPEARESDLIIFSDGAKNAEGQQAVDLVRKAADEAAKKNDFKSVTVIKREKNWGLAASIIDGVTDVLNKYGCIIVLEDDVLASPYLLKYFNKALDFYKNDKSVGCLAGYTPKLDLGDYDKDVFAARRSCSCCWATWKDRWEGVDWSMGFMKDFYSDYSLVKALNSNGNDRFMRLYRQSKKNSQSWSIRFGAHLIMNNYMTVYPRYSYIENIGCDLSGVHSAVEDAKSMEVDLEKAIADPRFESLTPDPRIQKILYRFYSGSTLRALRREAVTRAVWLRERLS
ncbi:MAG: glycosyltransferase [Clostridia bacterium]|nr:glycosyltransferase [Clostridia bacterium]